jgi:hypothetical protein
MLKAKILSILLFCSSIAYGAIPERINCYKNDKGPNGYEKVTQTWVSTSEGKLTCNYPGYEKCEWSQSINYPIDIELFTGLILSEFDVTKTSSGTMVIGAISFNYRVVQSFGNGYGEVAFHFTSGIY